MAHAINPNPEIYDHAMERASSSMGQGIVEARHWHRLTYGGLADLTRRSPAEIGHAAAYEAFRHFLHHIPVHDMMSEDHDRQRDILISLAIAEATRLWPETGRDDDRHGLQAVVEAAAATAGLIFSQHRDIKDLGTDHHRARSRAMYADTYTYDDEALWRRRRGGSHSPARGAMSHYSPQSRVREPLIPPPNQHIKATSESPPDVAPWNHSSRSQYDSVYGKAPSAYGGPSIPPVGGYPLMEPGHAYGNSVTLNPTIPYSPSNGTYAGPPGAVAGAYGAPGGAYSGAGSYGAMTAYGGAPNSAGAGVGAYGPGNYLASGQVGVGSPLPGPTIIPQTSLIIGFRWV
ncbi:hypothetical protein OF83DRAFT_1169484 [Amylostereum chailletii]|nr:hypothetical protein OF83DRAFT_1169484 [Amylostereum chailletii]